MGYEPVIGLEVHVQLKTNTKLFCSCSTEFGLAANENVCPVCTAQPGALPVINKKAVELSVRTALALNCTIHNKSLFARKSYFYPDLPKNYQISQYEQPLSENGELLIKTETGEAKRIRIKRIHLEEDAGKLIHDIGSRKLDYSLVDYNRTGIPLLEIVSEPDINSPDEAYNYLSALKQILQYIEISDCDMEKGFLRCDANASVHIKGEKLGTRTELKNMNSFKAVREALAYEINRQMALAQAGAKVVQETLLWDPDTSTTKSMRSKEEAHDYRYFPEPDLMPLIVSDEMINKIKSQIGELPKIRKQRFISKYGLTEYDAGVLTAEKPLSEYYENMINAIPGTESGDAAKLASNWLTTELLGRLNRINKSITESPVSYKDMAKLVELIKKDTISGKIAKTVFAEMFDTSSSPEKIVKEKGLLQITDESSIKKLVEEVVKENSAIVEQYKGGKAQAFGSLVGAVMKKSQGKANPQMVNRLLKELTG